MNTKIYEQAEAGLRGIIGDSLNMGSLYGVRLGSEQVRSILCRSIAVLSISVAFVPAAAQTLAAPWDGYSVIDMTHSFDRDTIYWPTEPRGEHPSPS